jgi:serine/threonine protein kinase
MEEALQPGHVLRGRYEIQELRWEGRVKKVYLAVDQVVPQQVVIDLFSDNSIMPSGRTVSQSEERVLRRLGDHPNIAAILDYWEDGETAVMVSPYLEGGSLQDLITRSCQSGESLSTESILQLSTEIANALDYIHRCRILYCDLQPRNVLFDAVGTIHLVDFDTAAFLDDHDMSNLPPRPADRFMAPELIACGDSDERADLYSLGATMYEMCQGCPFIGNRNEILTAGPSVERDDRPETLRELIFSLLAPDRRKRPGSAAEVVRRLDSIRTVRANLASNVEDEILKTPAALLNVDLSTIVKSPRDAQFRQTFTNISQGTDLSSDHRCLMLAIMDLMENDYRRAAIDASTAAEISLKSAISGALQAKALNAGYIDLTVRMANGLVGLFEVYAALGYTLPVSPGRVKSQLAGVRNYAAHAGQIPSVEEATRAVEVARNLVSALHPFAEMNT